jgi:hypothetical protein
VNFTDYFTNIGGIVLVVIFVVELLKRFAGNLPWFGKVPIWVYAVTLAAVFTELSHAVFHLLEGQDVNLIFQAVAAAATASGFREWFGNWNKPMSASSTARQQRGEIP